MRDFTDELEQRLTLAARAEARRGPLRRAGREALAVPPARPAAAIAVLVAIVIAVVLVSAPAAPRPVVSASVVSFRYPTRGPDSDYIVATVTDPFASQRSLDAAFKAAGLDITVSLVPASPSAVGTLVAFGGTDLGSLLTKGAAIQPLFGGGCVEGPRGCPIAVKVAHDFDGKAFIALGRPARPGESYESTNSAFAPGEDLHCSGLFGAHVSTALRLLATDHLTVEWAHTNARNITTVNHTAPARIDYIWMATPVSATTIRLDAHPTLPSASLVAQQHRYDQGCPSSASTSTRAQRGAPTSRSSS